MGFVGIAQLYIPNIGTLVSFRFVFIYVHCWLILSCYLSYRVNTVMNTFFIDKIDNIQAEFPLLEENLPSYSFLSMDSLMSMCPTGL